VLSSGIGSGVGHGVGAGVADSVGLTVSSLLGFPETEDWGEPGVGLAEALRLPDAKGSLPVTAKTIPAATTATTIRAVKNLTGLNLRLLLYL